MDEQVLPNDFKEFLRLLTEADAEYLLIGGYAVGYQQTRIRAAQGLGRSGAPT